MALGREVEDRIGPVAGEDAGQGARIADVGMLEGIARRGRDRGHILEAGRVGERIEIEDFSAVRTDPIEDEVGTDKAGAAGDENGWSAHG